MGLGRTVEQGKKEEVCFKKFLGFSFIYNQHFP